MPTVARSAFASSGVNARSACCTRLPSWASTAAGTSVGAWVRRTIPTPLERISRTVRVIASRKSWLASANSRCASSKKNTSLGWSRSPTSGRSWNRSASSHIRKVENSRGLVLHSPPAPAADSTPRPSGVVRSRSAVSNSGSPKNASPPCALQADQLAQDHPGGGRDRPPRPFRSSLPSALTRCEHGPQVLEVQQRQAGLVGVVEHQPEAGLLGVVEPQHLAQQQRAEGGDGGPHRHAGARGRPATGTRTGKPRGCQSVAGVRGPRGDPVAGRAGRGQPGQVALDVGQEDRHAGGGQLLGDQLQGLGLAGAGGPGDQAVPVDHRQRHRTGRPGARRRRPRPRPAPGPARWAATAASAEAAAAVCPPLPGTLAAAATPAPSRDGVTDRLVWIDCEMTGLELGHDLLIEIAVVVTDSELNILGDGLDLVIGATAEQLAGMLDVVRDMHAASGLTEEVRGRDGHPAGGRAAGPGVHPRARAGARQGAAVRQLDRHRPGLPGPGHARARRLPALPDGRRLLDQGAGPPLVPAGLPPATQEGRRPPGARRHPRVGAGAGYYR